MVWQHFIGGLLRVLVPSWLLSPTSSRKGSSCGLSPLLRHSRRSRRSWPLPLSFAF